MNTKFVEARELIAKAREALRNGDRPAARKLGERAALLVPEMEDAWLILAASDPNPTEALAYAKKALELNPDSARAQRAVEWATGKLKQAQVDPERSRRGSNEPQNDLSQTAAHKTVTPTPRRKYQGRNWLVPVLLLGVACVAFGFLAFFALTSPALASIVSSVSAPAPTQENLWAPAEIAKPSITPINVSAFAQQLADTPTPDLATPVPGTSPDPTETPALAPTEVPTELTAIPEATATPGAMAMTIIEDTPTSEFAAPAPSGQLPAIASNGKNTRWIDVDLTHQSVYAYEGETVVNSFIVSTGTWLTPTVTGQYKIYVKLRYGNMSGPGYFLPDVPYIMYFYESYGLHGTYWHHNFGTPMSYGCVNLRTEDAAWLFNWASVGTLVNVHY